MLLTKFDSNCKNSEETRYFSISETTQSAIEIPDEIVAKAYQSAEVFFGSEEMNGIANEALEWTEKICFPIFLSNEILKTKILSQAEIQNSLKIKIPSILSTLYEHLNTLEFSRGYEKDNFQFPTEAQYKPFALKILELEKIYIAFRTDRGFALLFDSLFEPFLSKLIEKIRSQALASRENQLTKLKSNVWNDENEYQKIVIEAHIDALKNKFDQPILELRDLLNLSRISDRKSVV